MSRLIVLFLLKPLLTFSDLGLFVFEDLPDFQSNLTDIYNNVDKYNYSILLETAVGYYDELKELMYAVNYKEHDADLMLRKVFDDGGPQHAYNPPYDKITNCYQWSKEEKLGYKDLMNKTCKVWNALKVKVKNPEDLESESSGNF